MKISLFVIFLLLLSSCLHERVDLFRGETFQQGIFHLVRNRQVRHVVANGDQIIFDVEYTTNQLGLRPTLWQNVASKDLILAGGSNTFGEGVSDEDTFAWKLSKLLSDYRVYNLGQRGYGPAHLLMQLRENIIPEFNSNGLFIYFMIPDHLNRVISSWRYRLYGDDAPLFELNSKGELHYLGEQTLLPPLWNNFLFKKVLSSFENETHQEMVLTVALLKEVEKEYRKRASNGKFLVVLSPFSNWKPEFLSILNESGLKVIQYSVHQTETYLFPHNYHLNVLGHQRITDLMFGTITKSHW